MLMINFIFRLKIKNSLAKRRCDYYLFSFKITLSIRRVEHVSAVI